MEPEVIADYQCEIGEGPLWHPIEKRIYWGDISGGRIFRLDPATGEHEEFFRGAIRRHVSEYYTVFGHRLVSVYVWGSVHLNEAVPEVSDLDLHPFIKDANLAACYMTCHPGWGSEPPRWRTNSTTGASAR